MRLASLMLFSVVSLSVFICQAIPAGFAGVFQMDPDSNVLRPSYDRGPLLLAKENIEAPVVFERVGEQEHKVAAFINAARVGDLEAVKGFLAKGVDVNERNQAGETALMEACANGKVEVVKLLIEKGADAKVRDKLGESAVIKAFKCNDFRILNSLASKGNLDGEDIILGAMRYGNEDLLRPVLAKTKGKEINPFWLAVAASASNVDALRLLLDKGVDPNSKARPALHVAVQAAPLASVELLLSRGAKVNGEDESGATPLLYACKAMKLEAARLLLDRGADVDRSDKQGMRPLMEAVKIPAAAYDAMVKLLLESKANPNLTGQGGLTSLMVASGVGRANAARMLLDAGAHIDARSKDGLTALMIGSFEGALEPVKLLLQRGAKIDARGPQQLTALMLAIVRGHAAVVEALLSAGADPRLKAADGRSALDAAEKSDNKEIVSLLANWKPK